jgi:ABC transporter substrate binding protein
MKRREFVGLAAAAAAWPFAARAQQVGGMRRLGVLAGYAANDPLGQMLATVLPQGLAALGWSDGQNIHLDWRWASGDPKLYESYAAELVALRPDVFVVQSSPAVQALRRSTSTIPTVFIMITDPLGQGFVNNLAHPGGNMTGFSDYEPLIAGKWVELLKQIKPTIARVALLYNPASHTFRRSHSTGRRARRPIVCSDGPLLSLPRRCGHRCLDETCSRRARRRAGDAGSFHHGASRRHRRRCGTPSGAGHLP